MTKEHIISCKHYLNHGIYYKVGKSIIADCQRCSEGKMIG